MAIIDFKQTFLSPTLNPRAAFGSEVAIDGNQVLIGARFDNRFGNFSGGAYLFDATTGNLSQTYSHPSFLAD